MTSGADGDEGGHLVDRSAAAGPESVWLARGTGVCFVRCLRATGLRAADVGLFGRAASDPYAEVRPETRLRV